MGMGYGGLVLGYVISTPSLAEINVDVLVGAGRPILNAARFNRKLGLTLETSREELPVEPRSHRHVKLGI
jgi:hypothetical protein